MTMASLPEESLIALIRARVKAANDLNCSIGQKAEATDWVRSLVAGGFLEASDSLSWDVMRSERYGMNSAENCRAMDARRDRWDAFLSFMSSPTFRPSSIDPVYGQLPSPGARPVIHLEDAFKEVVSSAFARLVVDEEELLRISERSQHVVHSYSRNRRGFASTTWDERQALLTKTLCTAVALGMDDQIRHIVAVDPEVMTRMIPLREFLGKAMQDQVIGTVDQNRPLAVSAYFVALEYSQSSCLAALYEAGLKGDSLIAQLTNVPAHTPGAKGFDVMGLFEHYAPLGEPHVYAAAIRTNRACLEAVDHPQDDAVRAALIESLRGEGRFLHLRRLLPAFLDNGLLDDAAVECVRAGCRIGYSPLVDRFRGRIPWAKLGLDDLPPSDIIVHASLCSLFESGGSSDVALVSLYDMAREEGREDMFQLYAAETGLDSDPTGMLLSMEPLSTIINNNLTQLLSRFLDAGLDPNAPYNQAGQSPHTHAEAAGRHELCLVMRAHEARQKAIDAMALVVVTQDLLR